jgi:hypothetical protein
MIPRSHNGLWYDGYRLAHADAGVPVDPGLLRVTGVLDGGLDGVAREFLSGPDAPGAYVVPNLYLAEALIASLRSLDRQAPVCGAHIKEVSNTRSHNSPGVVYSMQVWAEYALARLATLRQNPGQMVQQTIVPFETCNMA